MNKNRYFGFNMEDEDRNQYFGRDDMAPETIAELEECKDKLLRAKAEFENQRKRCKREIEDAYKFAVQKFAVHLLPAKDSLEKGIDIGYMDEKIDAETLFEGMNSTLKILNEAFKSAGLEEINPLGEKFDPDLHEAMTVNRKEGLEPNIILAVYQKGYILNGRLIRPARVEVSG